MPQNNTPNPAKNTPIPIGPVQNKANQMSMTYSFLESRAPLKNILANMKANYNLQSFVSTILSSNESTSRDMGGFDISQMKVIE